MHTVRANIFSPAIYKAAIALLLIFLGQSLPCAVFAAEEKITECTIDGTVYKRIFEVHEASDGRIGILYRVGGITVDRSQLSHEFLESWGFSEPSAPKPATAVADTSTADWLRARDADELDAAVRAGLIRKIGKTIYDVRKSQPGWETITGARVIAISKAGAVLELPDRPENEKIIVVANLPMVQDQNQPVTALVKLIGFEKRKVKELGEITVACYDYGQICVKEQVPIEILSTGVIEGATEAWTRGRTQRAAGTDDHEASRTGSGFFVSPDGYLLTSYHVVARAAKVQVRQHGQILDAEVAQVDRTNDLALLRVTGTEFKWLPLASQAKAGLGENVFTIGYPNPHVQGMEPKYTEGTISGLDGFQDDPREYQISLAIQPGNSGGPVCNAGGEVVGIVRSTLNAKFALASSGSIPQNVNYAVKSSYALQLLQTATSGRDFSNTGFSDPSQTREAVLAHAQESVAMVMVFDQ
ncbi:MAG TPA: serine protease [Verrucomicrobiae bacterium]